MSIIKNIWVEELERQKKRCASSKERLDKYPKGSIQIKRINGKEYHYLVWREDGKIKSKYLGNDIDLLEQVRLQLDARKEQAKRLKKLLYDMKLLEKALKIK